MRLPACPSALKRKHMATEPDDIQNLVNQRYKHGFVTDIETESLPPG